MTASETNRKLTSVLKRLRSVYGESPVPLLPPEGSVEPLVGEIVFSLLLWESSLHQARAAYKRLHEQIADFNDLRVCFVGEIVPMLGDRYPLAVERSQRLKGVLQDIFRRQNRLSLDAILQAPREDAAAFVASLEGLPPFAAARVTRYRLELPAIPVDHRLFTLLVDAGVLADGEVSDALFRHASAVLEKQLKESDADEACRLFQAWSDGEGSTPRRERKALSQEGETAPRKPKKAAPDSVKPQLTRKPAKKKSGSP